MLVRICIAGTVLCLLVISARSQLPPDLFQAVAQGHHTGDEHFAVEAVKEALKNGANVNARDEAGWTPLMAAAQEGLPRVFSLLLKSGADVNAQSTHGETALMIAAGCFIVRKRAAVVPERHLPDAIRAEQLAAPATMVHALLEARAAVNAKRNDGRTALMNAAMMSWPEVVEMLLHAKADVNTHDSEGRLAIDYVDRRSYPEITKMLLKAGSKSPTGRSGRTVCDVQIQLSELGYDTGPIDCISGKQLANVLAEFQRKKAMVANGTLDSETLHALNIQ
jgi:Putative peptidoglycan binding domain/Ankyrin repeats (3 copies)/Ankyrin repeats (many copies)